MKKRSIGIREARINFSKLIREVQEGMEYIITDRGTPVARIVPDSGTPLSLEERIKKLEKIGLIEICGEDCAAEKEPVELPPGFSLELEAETEGKEKQNG